MFRGSFRQKTSRSAPTVVEADVVAPPSCCGASCASSEGHPNAIPMHATKHSNQERPNRQGVRNSIIGFVLSPKGPFEHPREPAQALALTAQTKRARATHAGTPKSSRIHNSELFPLHRSHHTNAPRARAHTRSTPFLPTATQ